METEVGCLGLEILGQCSYDPSNPKSYFTIGHLLSLIALLLAFSQLTKPIIKFRLMANNLKYRLFIFLIATAVVSVFVATVLPFIPGPAIPLLGYPVFWEVLSALLFIGIGTYLIVLISKPVMFTNKNALKYFQTTMSFIAKGDEKGLVELAEEINSSIPIIVKEAKKFNHWKAREAKERGEVYKVDELTKISNSILDVWSDKQFCKILVCRAPASAIKLISNLAINPNITVGYALSNQIINQSFENEDSILNREENFSGLGFFKNFMTEIFGDIKFVSSQYRPLQSWRHYKNTIEDWKVEKYCECTKMAFNAHMKSDSYNGYPAELSVPLDTMASIVMNQTIDLEHMPDHEMYSSSQYKVLSNISTGLNNIIKEVVENETSDLEDFDEETYDEYKDHSVYGALAGGIGKYFEKLSMAKGHEWFIRSFIIDIWMSIFGIGGSEISKQQSEIGKRVLFHLNKKIEDNLDPEKRLYPPIVKLFLSLNGIDVLSNDNSICGAFHNEFIKKIKEKYPLLYRREKEFALNMLPDSFTYDSEKNTLTHERFRGRYTELLLDSLNDTSSSVSEALLI